MKQYGLLAAVFGGTLAALLIVFLVIEQLGAAGTTADASTSPGTTDVAVASATPAPTARPRPSTSVAPSASASVAPSASATETEAPATATPRPAATAARTVAPGSTIDVVVPGNKFATSTVPQNGKITKLANGGIVISTDRTYGFQLQLTYKLPLGSLPSGILFGRVDAAVCGNASGDFWETYGPAGGEPAENEVTPPEPDGCWHYLGGTISDTTTAAIIRGATTFQIDKVVYTVTER